MKFTIIMPTYNDQNFITESLLSVITQSYDNWELIIIDDGSTDNSKQIILDFINKNNLAQKIRYIYQENKDQLNAIQKAIPYINGDYVYLLHSDDVLNDNTLINANKFLESNKNYDAIISDIITIDESSKETGMIKVNEYLNKQYVIAKELLWLGRNMYTDMAFFKKDIFIKNVFENYLIWNGPFWLNLNDMTILNVYKVDFPFFKYRVFEENYINNKLGKLCVINGEIRVISRLLNNYFIPLYNAQYYLYRIFNKLKLEKLYHPIYFNRETKNKYQIIKFVLNKRFTNEEIKENLYLNALLMFYKNNRRRTITINKIENDIPIYLGSDLRIFNKQIIENTINKFYLNLLKEMEQGFNQIIVSDEEDKNKIIKITKFLCIYDSVSIILRKELYESKV